MNTTALSGALSAKIPTELAQDLVLAWVKLRVDTATQTLEKATAGKFVETFVQILQHLETARYESRPDVDEFLRKLDSRPVPAYSDDLRICAARQARAMYTLRNKRNIAHKNDVDPNIYDQRVLYSQAQWVLTELLRFITGTTMQAAGNLLDQVQVPLSAVVEEIDNRRLVLSDVSAAAEILMVLHSAYPNWLSRRDVLKALDRRAEKTVANELGRLWNSKQIEKNSAGELKLTQKGFLAAETEIRGLVGVSV
jgi:hypothetical protein